MKKNEIISPNYPSNYSNKELCNWEILAPKGHKIVLNFQDFNLERSRNCKHDYLKVSDAHLSQIQQIYEPMCGQPLPFEPIISNGRKLQLKFKSGKSGTARGFKITYALIGLEIILNSCNNVLWFV